MTWILENPWPVVIFGAVAEIVLAVVLYISGRGKWLLAMGGVLVAVAALWLVERLVVTPREEVEQTIEAMARCVEENDAPGLLAHVSPASPGVRNDIKSRLGRLHFERAAVIGGPTIIVDQKAQPPTASASLTALVQLEDRSGQFPYRSFVGRIRAEFRKEGARWLLTGYAIESNR